VILAGLLVGIEPVGGDPDRLYRPIKAELARALSEGRLPFWTDRLGLGIPLVAESHAAAFYPLNAPAYLIMSVPAAYRMLMLFHYLLLVGATFAYARRLEIRPAGSAVAALAFGFCGFQSIHSSHEVFYHAIAFLPVCLYLAERFLDEGRPSTLAWLAIAYGLQLSLGHFQIQSWTAGLVALSGLGRLVRSPRRAGRALGLLAGLAWGGAIAVVQLGASGELARFVGFDRRPFADLAFFGFPPAHWVELFAPTLFRGIPGGPESPYWYAQGTTGYEACFYVGTVPLLLACVGLVSGGGRARGFWIAASVASFLLSILPGLWLQGYAWVASIPGMGLFRAPGRFAAIASLGLCLAAGRGFDRIAGGGRAWPGLALGWLLAAAAGFWGVSWCLRPDHARFLGGDRLLLSLGLAGASWIVATVLVVALSRKKVGPVALLAATAVELGALYYTSTTEWGWSIAVPEQSPTLAALAREREVGRVAGLLHDLPLRFGASPLFPHIGFTPPPPHPFLEQLEQRAQAETPWGRGLLRRFGVTHGVWDGPIDEKGVEAIRTGPDPALDRLVYKPPGSPPHASWRLVRYTDVMPQARAAVRARIAPDDEALAAGMGYDLDPAVVWYRAEDRPTIEREPRAKAATVVSWDGREAVVEHDGPCDLVINRTYYPGWEASVDDGPPAPVGRAELGVQVVHLGGAGTHKVRFSYRPTTLRAASWMSAVSLLLAAGVAAAGARRSGPSPREAS
jgi:hypothetical protein